MPHGQEHGQSKTTRAYSIQTFTLYGVLDALRMDRFFLTTISLVLFRLTITNHGDRF
jgi:hypothetical protein